VELNTNNRGKFIQFAALLYPVIITIYSAFLLFRISFALGNFGDTVSNYPLLHAFCLILLPILPWTSLGFRKKQPIVSGWMRILSGIGVYLYFIFFFFDFDVTFMLFFFPVALSEISIGAFSIVVKIKGRSNQKFLKVYEKITLILIFLPVLVFLLSIMAIPFFPLGY